MRYNLKVPFAQKEAAKQLGARWDAARKIWYVISPKAMEAFAHWAPTEDNSTQAPTASTARPLGQPSPDQGHPGIRTGPKEFKPLCSCAVLPWEHCEHTRLPGTANLDNSDRAMASK
jgi:hypothetical protein